MKITDEFTDDHLPCVAFSHVGLDFELCWTSNKIIGRLDMIETDDLPLTSLAKVSKTFCAVLTDPYSVTAETIAADFNQDGEIEPEDDDLHEKVTLYLDVGCLSYKRLIK